MATIVLVRHATTAATGKRLGGWTPGVHLDEDGIAQAERTAERLATLEVAAVYASPLERTVETARIVARPHGLRVRTRRGVGEVDYGEWTDRPLGQLRRRKLWHTIQTTPSRVTFPGGESIRAAQARAVETVETLATDHGDELVVVVSHADVIKAVLAHFVGMPLDTFQRLMIAPASISVLALPEGGPPALLCCNDTGTHAGTGSAPEPPAAPRRPDSASGGPPPSSRGRPASSPRGRPASSPRRRPPSSPRRRPPSSQGNP